MNSRKLCTIPGFALILVLSAAAGSRAAQRIQIEPPPAGEFVLDYADLITVEDEAKINQIALESLEQRAIPILVVTIESMNKYGGAGLRIETFATLLYDQWGVGHERLGDKEWNKGFLLVVSRDDRHARIQMGAGWDREHYEKSQQIMNEQIVPRFKKGNFSVGVVKGVDAMNKLAQGEKLPRPPISWGAVLLWVGLIGLAVFTAVSLIRRGSSGWAWLLWGAVFGILGFILYNAMRGSGRAGYGGGGFSGGAFGGGFSGGGATGSW